MSLAQTVKDHPVIVYMGAVIAGFAAAFASNEALSKHSGMTGSRNDEQMKVEFLDFSVKPSPTGCTAPGALEMTERYTLLSNSEPHNVVVAHSTLNGGLTVAAADTTSVFNTDLSRNGWNYTYCVTPPFSTTFKVRFFDTALGLTSPSLTVPITVAK